MSFTRKTGIVLASVAAGVLAIGAAVPARMHRHGGLFGDLGFGGGMGRAFASLDRSDDQKSRVKAILQDEEPKGARGRFRRRALRPADPAL